MASWMLRESTRREELPRVLFAPSRGLAALLGGLLLVLGARIALAGTPSVVSAPLLKPPYGATYSLASSPASVCPGAVSSAIVTVKNTGSKTWTTATFHLAYHVLQGGNVIVFDGKRTALTSNVAPGASITFHASLQAPTPLGSYMIRWDMVEENVTWFSTQGVAPADQALTVASCSPKVSAVVGAVAIDNSVPATPARLDFPEVYSGDSKSLTVSLKAAGAGDVGASLLFDKWSQDAFHISELRVLGTSGLQAASRVAIGVQNIKLRVAGPPFRIRADEGDTVEVDVRFDPKFDLFSMTAGAKSATLTLNGPGRFGAFTTKVPLAGMFDGVRINVLLTVAPREVVAVATAATANVTATLTGIDGAGPGTIKATTLPAGVSLSPVAANVGKGQTIQVPLTFHLDWSTFPTDTKARDGEIAFEFSGGNVKAALSFAGLPSMISGGFADRKDCGVADAGAVVMVYPSYLRFSANIQNQDLINNRTVYIEARSGGMLVAGGILYVQFGLKPASDYKTWDSRNLPVNFYTGFPQSPDYSWVAQHPLVFTCKLVDSNFNLPMK